MDILNKLVCQEFVSVPNTWVTRKAIERDELSDNDLYLELVIRQCHLMHVCFIEVNSLKPNDAVISLQYIHHL